MVLQTSLDIDLIPETLNLINEFGKTVRIKMVVDGYYDPETQSVSGGGIDEITVKVSPPDKVKKQFEDGSTVKIGDTEVILPASGLGRVPRPKDVVVIDGGEWVILMVNPIFSGEQTAAYTLFLRR